MLNPMMPEDVAVTKIPRQSWKSWPEIFGFTQFQGLAIARRLHLVAQVLNVAFWALVLANSFPGGHPGQIIAAIIICPIMLLVFACFYRLLSEMTVSILLIPVLLVKQQAAAVGGNAGPQTNDADLAAYGVGGDNDMGTIV